MTNEHLSVGRRIARAVLPKSVRGDVYKRLRRQWPPSLLVRAILHRRLVPLSRHFGFDRGKPIDRFYIEDFVRRHSGASEYTPGAIYGKVLEIGSDTYALEFGLGVEHIDVLDASLENPKATIVADLTDGSTLPPDTYDCVLCLQTLLVIYDVKAAVETIHRILKPGGTALVTVPGISQICRPDVDSWGDYWRFTTLSARRLFEEVFEPANVTVVNYGNVLAASAFLYGLASEEMSR